MLCVLVWITAACASNLPALTLIPPPAFEATLILRTDQPPTATASRSPRTTATQIMATTPAPQHHQTPAPLPSPQFYTVVDGDTVASIAAQYNITLHDLFAANDGLTPELIYPGQMLLIPYELSSVMTETRVRLLPTHTPLPLDLPGVVCQHTPADEIICLGWVQNGFDVPVSGMTVGITLVDEDGNTMARRGTTIAQQVLRSGEGAPYAVRFSDAPDYADVVVDLLSAEWQSSAMQAVILAGEGMIVRGRGESQPSDVVHVEAAVQGDQTLAVQDVLIVITLFDADDQVTGYRIVRPDEQLAAGTTLALDLLVLPLTQGTARVAIHAEGIPIAQPLPAE